MRTPANEGSESNERESWRLIDSIPAPILMLTKTGDVDVVNRHLLEYFGTTIDKTREWGTNELVHREDLPQLIELFTRSIESGTPYESEQRLRRWDGVYRWFHACAFPLRETNGQVVRWCVLLTDIDERRRAEDALRASERNLQLIIDTLPALAWSAREDGSAEFFNRHYLEYTGLSTEQARGWSWTAAIHPDDFNALAARWQRIMASGEPGEAEARIRRFDGAYRWFLFRTNPLRDQSGNILKWYGTNLDIEDRKRGEEALRQRELSWRQIVDNIPGLVATMGAMGEVEFLNRQTLEYFGKTNEELKNWALIDAVHPEDLPRVVEARIRSIETGQVYEVEHRCRRADGVYRWFQVRGLPIRDADGAIATWYLLLTDVDDRKKAEAALQASERNLSLIINAIRIYIVVLRSDGTVLYVNQAVLDYHGLTLEDAQRTGYEGYRPRFFHPEDLERAREERQEARARGVPFEYEQRLLGKDGTYRWFLLRYDPLLDEQGKIYQWYVAGTDIDDRKKAEAALQASERNLRLITNIIPTHIYVLNTEGFVQYVNQAVMEYTGLSLDDVKQEDYRDRVIHPEDFKRVRPERTASLRRGAPFSTEQRVLGNDGEYRWFLVRYNPLLDQQGRIDRWYVAAFDIDDRKRAEAQVEQAYLRLAEAQRLSKTGSFITDLVADDHNWSEETFRIFGFDPAAKVTVHMIRDLVHPEDVPSFDAMIARAMTGTEVDFVFRIVTSGGTLKHIRGMARILTQIEGRPLFIGALQDVTDRKISEEALDRARSELAHVSRVTTLSALTGSIAHEINQPLSGIVTNAGTCLQMWMEMLRISTVRAKQRGEPFAMAIAPRT